MATTSIEFSPVASILHQESEISMDFPPVLSPSSDKLFWSSLRSRVDTILQNKNPSVVKDVESNEGASILKEDSALLLRGFDSVSQTLSQLSSNLENAMQRARDLSGPPTLTEVVQFNVEKSNDTEQQQPMKGEEIEADIDKQRGQKRKLDSEESSENGVEDAASSFQELAKIKKAKNIAISMATKAAVLARELKSMKSDLCFMQERCSFLEEENQKLRIGFSKDLLPEEDDLVRLQMETLLAEKSRLANENANLMRENRCLHQLVEYHQLTSQDLSASYENLAKGMCLDLSSSPPPRLSPVEDESEGPTMPKKEEKLGFCRLLDDCYDDDNL